MYIRQFVVIYDPSANKIWIVVGFKFAQNSARLNPKREFLARYIFASGRLNGRVGKIINGGTIYRAKSLDREKQEEKEEKERCQIFSPAIRTVKAKCGSWNSSNDLIFTVKCSLYHTKTIRVRDLR